jgi:hypothetical protein
LNKSLKKEDIYIIGRSIGSGGATFLANRKDASKLILISPFTTIPKVAS